MDQIVKSYGFESLKEFHSMVASVDISTPNKLALFKVWQDIDGSKVGLTALIKHQEADQRGCGNEVCEQCWGDRDDR